MRSTTQKLCAWLFVALLCYQCTAQKAGLQMLYMQHAQAAQLSVHSSGDVSLDLQGVQASLFFSAIASMVNQAALEGNPTNAVLSGLDLVGACSTNFVDAVVVLLNASVHDSTADGLVDLSYSVDYIDPQSNRSMLGDCLASAPMGNLTISNPVLMIDGLTWWQWLLGGIGGLAIIGIVVLGITIATGGLGGAAAVGAAEEVLDAAGVLAEDGTIIGEVQPQLQQAVEDAARAAAAAVEASGQGAVDAAMAAAEAAAESGAEGESAAENEAWQRITRLRREHPEQYGACWPDAVAEEVPDLFDFLWQNRGIFRRINSGWMLTGQQEATVMAFLKGHPNLLYLSTCAGARDATSRMAALMNRFNGLCR